MNNKQPKYLSVISAVEAVTGVRVSPATAWRWSHAGSKGAMLETWMLGGRRLTTVEAVRRFMDKRSAVDVEAASSVRKALEKELSK